MTMMCEVRTPNLRLETRVCVSRNEKMWRVKCAVHTLRRLQQIVISSNRFDYNKKNLAKCHFWAALWRIRTTGHSVLYAALSRAHMCLTLDDSTERHQESFHCHQDALDEKDDGCHFWFCQKKIGASLFSPDSRWRRCNFVNASLKSERSFIGSLRPGVEKDPPILFVSKVLVLGHAIGKFFCASLSIWVNTSSVRSMLSCDSRNVESFWKRSWILSKPFLMHFFIKLWAKKCFICSSSSHDDCHEVVPP